jgi:hypothetical protein
LLKQKKLRNVPAFVPLNGETVSVLQAGSHASFKVPAILFGVLFVARHEINLVTLGPADASLFVFALGGG